MSARWDPTEKTFVITGAASGLGALYTEWFLKEGAKSIAVLDVAVDKGQELAAKLNRIYSDKVTFYECDVSDETQLSDVFNQVVTKFGQVDTIINNAGIFVDSPNSWRRACSINWLGLVSLTLKGVKHMRMDEGGAGGTIINISSGLALKKTPYMPIYSGSKIAVLHFSHSMAMDPFNEHTGVRLMTLCLDATKTDLFRDLQIKGWDYKLGESLVNHLTTVWQQRPESAADTVVKMFKEGANGSIWLSSYDRPGEDITQIIDSAFQNFTRLIQ